MTILVTGGCGFIGTNFIHRVLDIYPDESIVNVDKLTYAGMRSNHDKFYLNRRYVHLAVDINQTNSIRTLIYNHKPNVIVHFAAESHVDNSINDSSPFIQTNIVGTHNLLECARKYIDWDYKFIHVSTDEVYGSLSPYDHAFTETTPYDPRSPYSASKAASDHLASAYFHTHNMPVIITNCSNNYGPYQHPEKFIPTIITKAMNKEKIPVYGTGENIRDWLYVTDHCDAIMSVIHKGKPGEKYNIGGKNELDNLSMVKKILQIMKKPEDLIEFVEDRKGHDLRYAIDNTKIQTELGWKPTTSFSRGLKQTVEWYLKNKEWVVKAKNNVNTGNNFSWR